MLSDNEWEMLKNFEHTGHVGRAGFLKGFLEGGVLGSCLFDQRTAIHRALQAKIALIFGRSDPLLMMAGRAFAYLPAIALKRRRTAYLN